MKQLVIAQADTNHHIYAQIYIIFAQTCAEVSVISITYLRAQAVLGAE